MLTKEERIQVDAANTSERPVVVFVHGLWLLPSSWNNWRETFEAAGYSTVAPSWPDDPETVEQARRHPEVLAGKGIAAITDHIAEVIGMLDTKPAIVGHSFGGLITQKLAGMGLAAVAVAIDPAPFKGVLPLPLSTLKSSLPVLGNPANRNKAIALTFDQFRFGWTNALSEKESRELFDQYHVAAPGKPLFQAALANYSFISEATVDSKNPNRGPLKIMSGEKDNTVPWAIANASFKKQKRNVSPTEIQEVPNRGHSLTIDSGWREVAEHALTFVQKHLSSTAGVKP
jgi:pimeloyl-ACP methyl ester carboxylesterase